MKIKQVYVGLDSEVGSRSLVTIGSEKDKSAHDAEKYTLIYGLCKTAFYIRIA